MQNITKVLGAFLVLVATAGAAEAAANYTATIDPQVNGTSVTFKVTVCKNSSGPTTQPKVSFSLFYNATVAPTSSTGSDQSWSVDGGIAPGKCYYGTYTKTGLTAGKSYYAYAVIIATDVGTSTNSVTFSKVYTAGSASSKPVYEAKITATPSGTSVNISIQMCNNGSVAGTQKVSFSLFANGSASPTSHNNHDMSWDIANGISANHCISAVTFTKTGLSVGDHKAYVYTTAADADTVVNSQSYKIAAVPTVPALRIESMTPTITGTSVTFKVKICNDGADIGTTIKFLFWHNKTDSLACAGLFNWENFSADISSLKNTCQTLDVPAKDMGYGSFTAVGFLDAKCVYDKTEADRQDNVKKTDYRIVEPGTVNLTASLSGTVDESVVHFTGNVCNMGAATVKGPFAIRYYYDESSAPSANTTADRTFNYPATGSIAPGGCIPPIKFDRPSAPTGSYRAWVLVDPTNVITESIENDNTGYYDYKIDVKPDLHVKSFDVTSKVGQVTYKAEVCNQGAPFTNDMLLEIWEDRSSAPPFGSLRLPSDWSNAQLTVKGMVKDDCQIITHNALKTNGSYIAWILADSKLNVTESDETNNVRYAEYKITDAISATKPDIVADSMRASVQGTTVTLTGRACNKGLNANSRVTFRFYLHSANAPVPGTTADKGFYVESLESGSCTEYTTFTKSNMPPGEYVAWLVVDPDETIAEESESNNAKSDPYVIVGSTSGKPDLVVSELAATSEGSSVSYQGLVCNLGAAINSPVTIGLFYDAAEAPACGASANDSTTIASMVSGECKSVSFNQGSSPEGVHVAYLLADLGCAVDEDSESNNVGTYTYLVGAAPVIPELTITKFQATVSRGTVYYEGTVCNLGAAISQSFVLGVFNNGSTAPSCGKPDHSETLIDVPASSCHNFKFADASLKRGTYTAWAIADAECSVVEVKEDNNAQSATFSLAQDGTGIIDDPNSGASGNPVLTGEEEGGQSNHSGCSFGGEPHAAARWPGLALLLAGVLLVLARRRYR